MELFIRGSGHETVRKEKEKVFKYGKMEANTKDNGKQIRLSEKED